MTDKSESARDAAWAGSARRLRVNPHIRIVRCSDDEILVKHGSRSLYSEAIYDEQRTRLLGDMIRNLREPATVSELRERGVLTDEQVPLAEELVDYLADRGVLVDPAEDLVCAYLNSVLGSNGQAARLSAVSIGMVGAGPLGHLVAREFASFRPQSFVLADDRQVPDGAVAMRHLSTPQGALSPGASYGEALARHYRELFGAEVRPVQGHVHDKATLLKVFGGVDFVLVAWESFSPTLFHAANEASVETGVPWMLVFLDGSEAVLSPLFVPGESGCYHEFEIQSEASILLKDEYLLYKEDLRENGAVSAALPLPPYLQVAAGFASTLALRYLMSNQAPTPGRAVRIDFERLGVDYIDVLKLPRCPACGSQRSAYRHLFL